MIIILIILIINNWERRAYLSDNEEGLEKLEVTWEEMQEGMRKLKVI